MARGSRRSIFALVLLGAVVYVIMSVAMAVATAEEACPAGVEKHWRLVPPGWECNGLAYR